MVRRNGIQTGTNLVNGRGEENHEWINVASMTKFYLYCRSRHGLLGKFGHFIGCDNQPSSSNIQIGKRAEGVRQSATISPMMMDSGAEASYRATAFLQVFLDHLGSENTFG